MQPTFHGPFGSAPASASRAPYACPHCEVLPSCIFPAAAPLDILGKRVHLAPGEALWRAGDRSDRLAFLSGGVLLASAVAESGARRAVGFELPGVLIGSDPSLWHGRRFTDVTALTPACVLVVPAALFVAAIEGGGPLSLALGQFMSQNHEMWHRLGEVGFGSVPERIARVLLRAAEFYEGPEDAPRVVPVPFTRTHLADLVGCRMETLVRALKSPPLSGLVGIERAGFVVASVGALRAVAGETRDEPPAAPPELSGP